jgi:hypothetical protein
VKLSVTIYGWGTQKKGEIVWDGETIKATGSKGVRSAARDPIMPWGIRGKIIKPEDEPEKFMRNLWLMYRSPYFGAVKAVSL